MLVELTTRRKKRRRSEGGATQGPCSCLVERRGEKRIANVARRSEEEQMTVLLSQLNAVDFMKGTKAKVKERLIGWLG
jgi:hypothetical protein